MINHVFALMGRVDIDHARLIRCKCHRELSGELSGDTPRDTPFCWRCSWLLEQLALLHGNRPLAPLPTDNKETWKHREQSADWSPEGQRFHLLSKRWLVGLWSKSTEMKSTEMEDGSITNMNVEIYTPLRQRGYFSEFWNLDHVGKAVCKVIKKEANVKKIKEDALKRERVEFGVRSNLADKIPPCLVDIILSKCW